MHYNTTQLPKSEIEITVSLSPEEMKPFRERTLREAEREIAVEGFRKGKAPRALIVKKIGERKIMEDAALHSVRQTYPAIVKELEEKKQGEFEPIGAPDIAITKLAENGAVEYRARVVLLPNFALPDYKKIARAIAAEKKTQEVTEKEIADSLAWLRESRATLVAAARPAEKGDRVEIDFTSSIGGAPIENGASERHPLIIGDGKFMPGFEDALIGMRENEEKKFHLVAPADYAAAPLRGKTIDFAVKMRAVQARTLPALSDAFAQSLGAFATLKDLEANIRNGLSAEKEEKERERIRMKIIDAIAGSVSIELPDMLVERELAKMQEELRAGVERMGMPWTDYLMNIKKSEDGLKKEWGEDAARRVKIALVLRRIGKAENIEPDEKEIQETTNQTVARLGIDEKAFQNIDRASFLEYNTTIARNEKVFRFLENMG